MRNIHWPRLTADVRKSTDTATEKLIATTGSRDLKVQGLIELTTFFRAEAQLQDNFPFSWNNPAIDSAIRNYVFMHSRIVYQPGICLKGLGFKIVRCMAPPSVTSQSKVSEIAQACCNNLKFRVTIKEANNQTTFGNYVCWLIFTIII